MNDSILTGAGEEEILSEMSADRTSKERMDKRLVNNNDLASLLEFFRFFLGEHKDKMEEISQKDVYISNVRVKIKDSSEIRFELDGKLVQIHMDYVSDLVGDNIYLIRAEDALRFAELLSKETNLNFSDFTLNTLSEGLLSIVEYANEQISNSIGKEIMVSTPKIDILDNPGQIKFFAENQIVSIHFTLHSDDTGNIDFYQIMSTSLAKEFLVLASAFLKDDVDRVTSASSANISDGLPETTTVIRPIRYQELDRIKPGDALSNNNIALLLDISMQLTVELGRSRMQIREILALGEGSIIELDKLAGEPVDLLVNNKLVAKGEVVVIDENFGVRITEIVMSRERLESLLPD